MYQPIGRGSHFGFPIDLKITNFVEDINMFLLPVKSRQNNYVLKNQMRLWFSDRPKKKNPCKVDSGRYVLAT